MKMTVNNRFAILLAEKRIKERRNISLSEIADATGISRKTLYAWENNKVNRFDVPVIDALCEYFQIQPGALFHYVKPEGGRSGKITLKNAPFKDGGKGIKLLFQADATVEDMAKMISQKGEKKQSRAKKKPAA